MSTDLNTPISISEIDQRFAYGDEIRVVAGAGGLPMVAIKNRLGEAHLYLNGGHLTHFQPAGAQPLLWVSPTSLYQPGKSIRGGIPVCWPWFGPHPSVDKSPAKAKEFPAHGFARTQLWTLTETARLSDGRARVVIELRENETTLAWFPYAFVAHLTAVIGATLELSLMITNTGSEPFSYTDALHTYFSVGDVNRVLIDGLDGTVYVDKTAAGSPRIVQGGSTTVTRWTDRVYVGTRTATTIVDPVMNRRVTIGKSGSTETVVWNPFEKAKSMNDFAMDEQPRMVCVETATCYDHCVTLLPGTAHTTALSLAVAAL